ncbi:FtsW/RodA/SpoVE family cell cycle protein [Alloscardovia venturai]|uniref:Probable peptidoglycan glycosyltransferase FtsW n=1 Tax=Alloscardovia venturai TaxID=1769421 RepID=A0ABW2Y735_9BIFI
MPTNSKRDVPKGILGKFLSFPDRCVAHFTRGSRLEHTDDRDSKDYAGWRFIMNPVASYWTLVFSVAILTVFGLVMVYSSTIARLASENEPVWKAALRQGIYAAVGIVLLLIVQILPSKAIKRFSFIAVLVAIALQALTLTPLGASAGGNSGWLILGPISLQPAEVMKLALCIWLPRSLIESAKEHAKKRTNKNDIRPFIWPMGIFLVCFLLVILGKDLGTAMIVALIGVFAFYISGFPLLDLGIGVLLGFSLIALLAVFGNSNRMNRILATYGGCSAREAAQATGICFQSLHGDYALATGGIFGVGVGNSREKWSYLPAADNDYIFAIIGEEWGFIGAVAVIAVIATLSWALINLSLRHQNMYMQIVLMCFTVWFTGQSFINIAVVLGALPVMGLPLPFISSGGSSLIMCLIGAGVCIRLGREQEDVKASLARA